MQKDAEKEVIYIKRPGVAGAIFLKIFEEYKSRAKKVEKIIDHSRGLCGKIDDSFELIIRCRCCGSKMRRVEPKSIGMQQVEIYAFICPVCPPSSQRPGEAVSK